MSIYLAPSLNRGMIFWSIFFIAFFNKCSDQDDKYRTSEHRVLEDSSYLEHLKNIQESDLSAILDRSDTVIVRLIHHQHSYVYVFRYEENNFRNRFTIKSTNIEVVDTLSGINYTAINFKRLSFQEGEKIVSLAESVLKGDFSGSCGKWPCESIVYELDILIGGTHRNFFFDENIPQSIEHLKSALLKEADWNELL